MIANCGGLFAQEHSFIDGEVSFFAEASVEDIAAKSFQITSTFNSSTGEIAFEIPIESFVFNKSLMKQHFNEKYMESEKYPNASFKGVVKGFNSKSESSQNVTASGKLTIHGVTRDSKFEGTITKSQDRLSLESTFVAIFQDFDIKIPKLFWRSVAEEVEVKVKVNYRQ